MAVKCPSCGYDNAQEAHFCANCGSRLDAVTGRPAPMAVPVAEAVVGVAVEYMGFWIRFGAAVIDYVIVSVVSTVVSFLGSWSWGGGPLFGFLVPLLYYWLFTGLKGQTLGKMAVSIKVVNSEGSVPGLGYAALREIVGKFISTIFICLGFLWIAWDRQKQGWHDKIASTFVVRVKSRR